MQHHDDVAQQNQEPQFQSFGASEYKKTDPPRRGSSPLLATPLCNKDTGAESRGTGEGGDSLVQLVLEVTHHLAQHLIPTRSLAYVLKLPEFFFVHFVNFLYSITYFHYFLLLVVRWSMA